jgi:hypothetical protein
MRAQDTKPGAGFTQKPREISKGHVDTWEGLKYNPAMPVTERNYAATRQSWKSQPIPTERINLGFACTYDAADTKRIKHGLIPLAMEDKWFMYFEEPWFYLHRSWTGKCVYGVRFEPGAAGLSAVESWVTQEEYPCNIEHDRAILGFLIEHEFLGRPAQFPVSQHPFSTGYSPSMFAVNAPKFSWNPPPA